MALLPQALGLPRKGLQKAGKHIFLASDPGEWQAGIPAVFGTF
jgi:hypothetical protein